MKKLDPFIGMDCIVLTECTSRTYDDIEPEDLEVGPELIVYREVKLV